jgi:hypothetical protein
MSRRAIRGSASATVASDPVITRVVAIEAPPPGSPATRRLIAEWSDGTQAEALAWFDDLCGHPHKSSSAYPVCSGG